MEESTMVPPTNNLVSEAYLEELGAQAEAIYSSKLKILLEREYRNQFVAIHVPTGEYAVAPTFREAKRAMLDRHSIDGKLVVMKIGEEPEIDPTHYHSLVSEQKATQQK